ncbi:hypothetical protein STEG23_000517 [Scotinomys teguina]
MQMRPLSQLAAALARRGRGACGPGCALPHAAHIAGSADRVRVPRSSAAQSKFHEATALGSGKSARELCRGTTRAQVGVASKQAPRATYEKNNFLSVAIFDERVCIGSVNQNSILQSDNVVWSIFIEEAGSSLSGCAQVNPEEDATQLSLYEILNEILMDLVHLAIFIEERAQKPISAHLPLDLLRDLSQLEFSSFVGVPPHLSFSECQELLSNVSWEGLAEGLGPEYLGFPLSNSGIIPESQSPQSLACAREHSVVGTPYPSPPD